MRSVAPRPLPRLLVWPALVAVFFAAIAPTLTWQEFSGGMENLNIATALELRRDHPGNWLIPTLEGESRVKKPPLTAWLTAAAIRPSTVADLSSPDAAVRHAAARWLAWEVRWPALLAACLTLVAVYELGRVVADAQTGLAAALICGTTLMFLKFGRSSMIDVHLGLWVAIANVFLAHAILKGRRWSGCVGAGVALGIAFLIKGPIGWVQSLLPAVAYAIWRAWRPGDKHNDEIDDIVPAATPEPWLTPALVGALLMLAIALPWYLYVLHAMPGAKDTWTGEATAERGEKPSSFYQYFLLLPYLLPWTICFIGGLIHARRRGAILAVVFALLPLLVMSLYKDRKDRYIFPVTGAAAVVAATGLLTLARKSEPWTGLDRVAVAQQWLLLIAFGLLFPAAASTSRVPGLTTMDGRPLLPAAWGAGLTIGLGVVIALGMLARRHWLASLLAVTTIVMLAVQAAAMHGYIQTEAGLSPMRPLAESIWRTHPDAEMLNAHPRGKRASVDLSIYLNRITRWISMDDLKTLQPGPRPKVVVMLQEQKDPAPTAPAGWTFVDKVPRDKDWWWAFALPAAPAR